MAIRLKVDGMEVETDSAAEAIEMYRQIKKFNKNGSAPLAVPQRTDTLSNPATITLGSNAKKMVRFLLARSNGERTTVVAQELGVNGPKGLAAVTRQIRAWGKASFHLNDEQCVHRSQGVISIPEPLANKLRGHEKELLG